MSKGIAKEQFRYSDVDVESKEKLIYYAGQIKIRNEKAFEHGKEIGKAVYEAHKILTNFRKGLFDLWVESETPLSRRTAFNLVALEEKSANYAILHNLPQTVGYLLSAKGTPDAAIEEVEKAVKKGVKPTIEMAEEAIKKHKPKRKKRDSGGGKSELGHEAKDGNLPKTDGVPVNSRPEAAAVALGSGPKQFDDDFNFGVMAKEPKVGESDLKEVFEICEEFDAQRAKIAGIKAWITRIKEHPGAAVLAASAQRIITDLDQADAELKFAKPFSACPYCKNNLPKIANCESCKGFGWVTEPVFARAPKELKEAARKAVVV